jgi:hypothetical protein
MIEAEYFTYNTVLNSGGLSIIFFGFVCFITVTFGFQMCTAIKNYRRAQLEGGSMLTSNMKWLKMKLEKAFCSN